MKYLCTQIDAMHALPAVREDAIQIKRQKATPPCRHSLQSSEFSPSFFFRENSPPLRVGHHERSTGEAQRSETDHGGADAAGGDGCVTEVAKHAARRRRAAAGDRRRSGDCSSRSRSGPRGDGAGHAGSRRRRETSSHRA